jgi:hypothetical protein
MGSPGDDELTDEDFIPRNEPDPIEELRRYIRQRLGQGATQREVEDELSAQGLDPVYASEMVSSVRTTGQYDELEVGTAIFLNGLPAGFFKNPVFERKLRLARRQRRLQREAQGETNEPNPELCFDGATTPGDQLARHRSRERRRLFLVGGALLLVALILAAYVLLR